MNTQASHFLFMTLTGLLLSAGCPGELPDPGDPLGRQGGGADAWDNWYSPDSMAVDAASPFTADGSVTNPACVSTAEICDGKDNNCDRTIDESHSCGGSAGPTGSYRCSGSLLQQKWLAPACKGGKCVTLDSYKTVQDCGTPACSAWGPYYCDGQHRKRKRTCIKRGCAGNACVSKTAVEYQKTNCGASTSLPTRSCCGPWSGCAKNHFCTWQHFSGAKTGCTSGVCYSKTYSNWSNPSPYGCSGHALCDFSKITCPALSACGDLAWDKVECDPKGGITIHKPRARVNGMWYPLRSNDIWTGADYIAVPMGSGQKAA